MNDHTTATDLPPCPGRHNTPTTGAPVWCRHHEDEIGHALRSLPRLYRRLLDEEPTSAGAMGRRSTAVDPGSPSPGADHADRILRDLTQWEDTARAAFRHPGSRYAVRHGTTPLHGAVGYLTRHERRVLSAPFAEDYGREITALATTADRILGGGPQARRVTDAVCPACNTPTLLRRVKTDGTDHVTCTTCHRRYDTDDVPPVTWDDVVWLPAPAPAPPPRPPLHVNLRKPQQRIGA